MADYPENPPDPTNLIINLFLTGLPENRSRCPPKGRLRGSEARYRESAVMKSFAEQALPPAARRRSRIVAVTLCSVLALAGCASTGAAPKTELGPREAAQAQIDEPALKEAAIESTKTQDYVAAAAYWGALYERSPDDASIAVHYSKALRQIGSIEQSLSVMQRAQIKAPENADVLSEFGKALTASGRPDQAFAILNQAAKSSPRDWTIQSALGVALDQMGRYEEAKAHYNNALGLSPDNPSVLTNLGLSYALTGDLNMAERTLRRAVADQKADAYARQNLAIVLGLKGNFDEAERLARADLPANVADSNMAYLRAMLSQPALWKQMEELDRKPAAERPESKTAVPNADQVSSLPPETDLSL
ncbi:MAG TPA: pilus assembly protein TadD [Rhodobiaceae bacterium]|nr:pilus assembly protein TadD [Rhodobiaceae bacterium]